MKREKKLQTATKPAIGYYPCVSGSVFFTTEEVKDLKRIRNYFGEHDKTLFEHWAYSYLDNILKRIHTDR